MAEYGIDPIDLVVSNLYPFGSDTVDLRARRHPGRGADRHRRAGHDPGRGQELKDVGIVTEPADYRVGGRRAEGRRRPVRRHQAGAGPQGLRPHRGLRRVDRGLVRRGPRRSAAAHPPPRPRAGAGPALRREPAPDRRPLPRGRHHVVVGRRRAARRDGPQLPQPLRRRRRVGPGQRPRQHHGPAGRRHHQARQPVRRGGGRHPRRGLPAGLRVRRALGLRRHRGPVAPGRRRHRRADGGRRPGRRGDRPRLRRRGDRGADQEAQEHPPAHRQPADPGRAPDPPAHRLVARAGRPPLRGRPRRLAGRHQAAAHRGRVGRRRAGLAPRAAG